MGNISFGNLTTNNTQLPPELLKRAESQENFTALNKEKLKQDTVEIASKASEKAKENVKDNFIFRILKNLGVEEPKKFLKSLAYTTITIVGIAVFGNKMSNKFADWGLKCDEILQGDGFKWARNASKKLGNIKNNISNFFKKSKTINDITSTLSDSTKKLRAKIPMAKSQCAGPKFQFSCAVIESMQGIFYGKTKNIAQQFAKNIQIDGTNITSKKLDKDFIRKMILANGDELEKFKARISGADSSAFIKAIEDIKSSSEGLLEKLIGKDNVKKAFETIIEDNARDRVEFADKFSENIRKLHGTNGAPATNKELLNFFKKIQKGEGEFADCKDILMCHGIDDWTFTNLIDKVYSKISGGKHISRANLGSTLIKYNAVSGKLADSAIGKFVQGFPTISTESISNHVCDMAAVNMIVFPSFISLFNNVQDAPKEQKGATLANNFITDVGHITLVIPAAAGLTYGLASLSNMEGKTLLSKGIKAIGNVFALGLKNVNKGTSLNKIGNKLKGFGGGALRFVMIMFVFSNLISKPIQKLTNKIFGKPYDPEEAEKERQLEEAKKQIIPELGITQGELLEKMQNNPEAVAKLQTDAKLAQTIAQNPKALLDLLDNKPVQYIEPKPTPASQGIILSPANQKAIQKTNQMQKTNITQAASTQTSKQTSQDTATYIPSSTFSTPVYSMSQEQTNEYNALMAKSDKLIQKAERYI